MISVSLSMPTYFRASAWLYLQDRKVTAAVMTSCAPHKRVHRKQGQPCTPASSQPLPKVPVIKEKLLSRLDGPLGKDPYPVVSIHHHDCNQRDYVRERAAPAQAMRSRSTFALPGHQPAPGATVPALLPSRNGALPGELPAAL